MDRIIFVFATFFFFSMIEESPCFTLNGSLGIINYWDVEFHLRTFPLHLCVENHRNTYYHIFDHFILSHLILSHPISSYPISSHLILSHLILLYLRSAERLRCWRTSNGDGRRSVWPFDARRKGDAWWWQHRYPPSGRKESIRYLLLFSTTNYSQLVFENGDLNFMK